MGGAAATPSVNAEPVANSETWLDFTDLVFIDPVGTGYSGFTGNNEDTRRRLWSVDGDIQSLADVMRRWLEDNGRITSPKFIAGESYGGFRGPRLVRAMREDQGIGIRGLVLISPALDLGSLRGGFNPLSLAFQLPTMAAAIRSQTEEISRAMLTDVERYAATDYVVDLLRGNRDPVVVERRSRQVAALTGLDLSFVLERRGRLDSDSFLQALRSRTSRVASPYDATALSLDPYPGAIVGHNADPVLDGLAAPVTSGMLALYSGRLGWRPEARRYELLNRAVSRGWDWGRGGRPEALSALRTALALDPQFRVLVAHGLFDLVTPYFSTDVMLNQIPESAGANRIRFETYPGGHMFYSVDVSRAALRVHGQALIEQQ